MKSLQDSMDDLSATVMRVKAERDEAIMLLREGFDYTTVSPHGPYKAKVRGFLERVCELEPGTR